MKSKCFVIAEAGVNHNKSIAIAKQLVDAAKDAGVDAIKFQVYKTGRLIALRDRNGWYKNEKERESTRKMLKSLELGYDDFREIKKYCDKKGIMFLCTPHSCKSDIDLVAELCPMIKIASGNTANMNFLRYAAKKGKPIMLSTGGGRTPTEIEAEITSAVMAITEINKDLTLMYCVSKYPCEKWRIDLGKMAMLRERYNLPVGFSDHTTGIRMPVLAAEMGAVAIEKHFTLDRNMGISPDHRMSIEPDELAEMVKRIRRLR